jgi:HlyD family secretion protein
MMPMAPTPRRFWRQTLLWGGVFLVVAVLVWFGLRPAPIDVEIAHAEGGSLQVVIEAEGKTRVRERFVISAPVSGRLARLTLEPGDAVERGDIVARLDPLPLDAAVKSAKARLAEWQAQLVGVDTQRPKPETLSQARARIRAAQATTRQAQALQAQARAAFEQAQRTAQRAERLVAAGTISREAYESEQLNAITRREALEAARLEAQRAASEVAAAQAALAILQARQHDPAYLLDVYHARIDEVEAELTKLRDDALRTTIQAPISGRVLRVLEKHARVVTAGTGLLEIGDLHDLEIVIDVLSTDATRITPGMAVVVSPNTRAIVQRIEPSAFTKVSALGVEEQRVNVIATFEKASNVYGDAYRVEAKIVVWERHDVLKLPLSALFRCQRAWCVFTVENDRAKRVQVQLGHRSDIEAEVQSGLQVGTPVVVYPAEQIADGHRVRRLRN